MYIPISHVPELELYTMFSLIFISSKETAMYRCQSSVVPDVSLKLLATSARVLQVELLHVHVGQSTFVLHYT